MVVNSDGMLEQAFPKTNTGTIPEIPPTKVDSKTIRIRDFKMDILI